MTTFGRLAGWGVHGKVVNNGGTCSRASLSRSDVIAGHDQGVVVEAVDVVGNLRADAEALLDVSVEVVEVHVVVPSEVVLHALVARDEHVVWRWCVSKESKMDIMAYRVCGSRSCRRRCRHPPAGCSCQ